MITRSHTSVDFEWEGERAARRKQWQVRIAKRSAVSCMCGYYLCALGYLERSGRGTRRRRSAFKFLIPVFSGQVGFVPLRLCQALQLNAVHHPVLPFTQLANGIRHDTERSARRIDYQ